MLANFFGVEFYRTVSKFRRSTRKLLFCVPALDKTWNIGTLFHTTYKKGWCTCKVVCFVNLNLLFFFCFFCFFFCRSHCRRCRHCLNSLLGVDGSLRRGCDVLIAFSLPPKDPPTPPDFKVQAKSKIVTKRRKNVQTYKAISHSKTVRIITTPTQI